MAWLGLIVCAALLLVQPAITIHAASDACALFAQSVLPGLYPYMILLLLLLDRLLQPPIPRWWRWAGARVRLAAQKSAQRDRRSFLREGFAACMSAAAP